MNETAWVVLVSCDNNFSDPAFNNRDGNNAICNILGHDIAFGKGVTTPGVLCRNLVGSLAQFLQIAALVDIAQQNSLKLALRNGDIAFQCKTCNGDGAGRLRRCGGGKGSFFVDGGCDRCCCMNAIAWKQ